MPDVRLAAVVCCLCAAAQWPASLTAQQRKSVVCDDTGRCLMGWNFEAVVGTPRKDVRAAADVWLVELGKAHGLRAASHIYDNIHDIVADFGAGKLDMVGGTALDYLYLDERFEVEVAFVGMRHGRKAASYRVLARADSGVEGVKDLHGKRLAMKKGEDVGLLYLNVLLLRERLGEAPSVFGSIQRTQKYSRAVLAVFFGKADACIVREDVWETMVALNPQIGRRLKVLASSPELVDRVLFFRKAYNQELKDLILRQAVCLNETPAGMQLLTLFRMDSTALLRESDLDSVRDLLKEYRELGGGNQIAAGN